MGTDTIETVKRKVFPKGQVVISISLRKKYQIDIGDRIDVISKPDGILLKPLPKENRQRSLTERLFGIFSDYATGKTRPTKADIKKATEAGFTEGWDK